MTKVLFPYLPLTLGLAIGGCSASQEQMADSAGPPAPLPSTLLPAPPAAAQQAWMRLQQSTRRGDVLTGFVPPDHGPLTIGDFPCRPDQRVDVDLEINWPEGQVMTGYLASEWDYRGIHFPKDTYVNRWDGLEVRIPDGRSIVLGALACGGFVRFFSGLDGDGKKPQVFACTLSVPFLSGSLACGTDAPTYFHENGMAYRCLLASDHRVSGGKLLLPKGTWAFQDEQGRWTRATVFSRDFETHYEFDAKERVIKYSRNKARAHAPKD